MTVEFLSDAEAEAFGRFDGPLSRADLDRVFFLDDTDRELIVKRRGPHNRRQWPVRTRAKNTSEAPIFARGGAWVKMAAKPWGSPARV